jgi:hypothetical protein
MKVGCAVFLAAGWVIGLILWAIAGPSTEHYQVLTWAGAGFVLIPTAIVCGPYKFNANKRRQSIGEDHEHHECGSPESEGV